MIPFGDLRLPDPPVEPVRPRPAPWYALAILAVLAWNVVQVGRFSQPPREGHDGYISRQIGGAAYRHLAVGFGRTGGSNTWCFNRAGAPVVHKSYPPLSSWTVAVPLAAGLPFNAATRLPVLLSMNLFFLGLWGLAVRLWGVQVAGMALAFAAGCPVVLLKYPLLCVFESLALGPLMACLALLAGPGRRLETRAAILVLAAASVLYSWICWVAILPCLAREAALGRRAFAAALVVASIVLPVGIYLVTISLSSEGAGGLAPSLVSFFGHLRELASGNMDETGEQSITFVHMVRIMAERCLNLVGRVPTVLTLALMARLVAGAGETRGWAWLVLLVVFALPLNLFARNVAFHHDFFILLMVPALALGSARAALGLFGGPEAWAPRRLVGVAVLLLGFLYLDVLPHRGWRRSTDADRRQEQIADLLAATIGPADLVIVNRGADIRSHYDRELLRDLVRRGVEERESIGSPPYFGRVIPSVFLAFDEAEAAAIASEARPGQRVVVVEADSDHFPLPPGFRPVPHSVDRLVIGTRGPG